MAQIVKHVKVSAVPDGSDTNQVQPSDWNANHALTGAVDYSELTGKPATFPPTVPIAYANISGTPVLASTTEVLTGTDAAKVATPDAMAALWEAGTAVTTAATTLIPEGGYFTITGAGTIAAFDYVTASKNGRVFIARFATAGIAIANSANLILPGAANITTQVGDVAIFVQSATGTPDAFVCISYQFADGRVVSAAIASTTDVLVGTDTAKAVTSDAMAAQWERGADMTTAATLNLGEGGYFTVTGAGTITDVDFATPKDGRAAWVRFLTAGIVLTNSATLILPGGANITTQVGDTACFVQHSGDTVVCFAFQSIDGYLQLSGGTLSGDFIVAKASPSVRLDGASGNANLYIQSPAGNERGIVMRTGSLNRWKLIANNTAEGGSEAGSNLTLTRYNDAGATIDVPLSIARSSGIVAMVDGFNAGSQSEINLTATGTALLLTSTEASAVSGPNLFMFRDSPTPAANDVGSVIYFAGRNSAAANLNYAQIYCTFTDVNSVSEDSILNINTTTAGTGTTCARFGSGVYVGSPTGGDKGVGTLNAAQVYDDNVLLTCMALSEQFRRTGKFDDADLAEWDAKVPPLIIEEVRDRVPVEEEVEIERIVKDPDGRYRKRMIKGKQFKTITHQIYNDDDEVVGQIKEQVFRDVIIPARVVERQHHTARVFKDMIDSGFDPRDPSAFVKKMYADGAMPGMPKASEWTQNEISVGEMVSRLWLSLETIGLAFDGLVQQAAGKPADEGA